MSSENTESVSATSPATTTTTTSASNLSSIKPKKVVVPKVWKRPHSTIYGKNVEFGSSLYSDKLGEINGRKFNSELPWTMRNSGLGLTSASGSHSQGYLSNQYLKDDFNHHHQHYLNKFLINNSLSDNLADDSSSLDKVAQLDRQFDELKLYDFTGKSTSHTANNFVRLLHHTNPNRLSKNHYRPLFNSNKIAQNNGRLDFYEQYGSFCQEIDRVQAKTLQSTDALVMRHVFDDNLDFDYSLGFFVPKLEQNCVERAHRSFRSGKSVMDNPRNQLNRRIISTHKQPDINSTPISTQNLTHTTNYFLDLEPTRLHVPTTIQLETHKNYGQFGITNSPYGPSLDGRKLSLGSINPHSYRPSLPSKTTTAHASDGEEFEFHDRSSPFYTDRWAGKTIRHFDSDLYSNANLFKSMIL